MDMKGKRGLIAGVANKWSLAWAIAQKLHAEGAEIALTYQNDRMAKNLRELAPEIGNPMLLPLDVTSDRDIVVAFDKLYHTWGKLDFVVHSVAFAPRAALDGAFVDTSREDFRIAHDISAYSLTALAHAARPLMTDGGTIVTLSYLGAERVVPHYNVMGVAKASLEASVRYLAYDLGEQNIRVNAVSAGPIKTLAASGIAGFGSKQRIHRNRAPLHRDVESAEVADAAYFLLNDQSRGITGQVLYVDGGFSIMGD